MKVIRLGASMFFHPDAPKFRSHRPTERKLIIRIARGGDVLGLYAGLTGRPFEATAEMVEGGRVDFISRQDLLGLLGSQHSFGLDLVEMFSRQFSDFVDHTRMLALV